MKGGKQRSGFDLEGVARHLGDTAGDGESVQRFEREDFQDEHVERALQEGGIGSRLCHTDILVI